MAQKKKKKRKSKSKSNNLSKVLTIIIFIAIVAAVAYVGITYYPQLNSDYENIDNAMHQIDETIEKEVTSDLDLKTLIEGNATIISWESSDPQLISKTGKVTRPSYSEGDKVVTLTARYTIPLKDSIAKILYDALGYNEKTSTHKVKVLALDPTDEEKILITSENLIVPEKAYKSLTLPTTFAFFDSVEISWSSSDTEVMSHSGVISTPLTDTNIKLTATIKSGTVSNSFEYDICVLSSEPMIEEVNVSFNDISSTTKYTNISNQGFTFVNGMVKEYNPDYVEEDPSEVGDYSEKYIRLRSKTGDFAYFKSNDKIEVGKFVFSYLYSGTQSGNDSHLAVYTSTDDITWDLVEKVTIIHEGKQNLSYDLNGNYYIKVVFEIGYSECFVDIDDVKVIRKYTQQDVEEYLKNNIPAQTSKYIKLPFSTVYGGSITYVSDNPEILSNEGVVIKLPEEATIVNLTATINYFDSSFEVHIPVKIVGSSASTPVEIYFIDLGKYGTSDCGESIYIKYGSIDILIDSGDNFDSSKRSVSETINQVLDDEKLDYVIATHPDSDHIGGMVNVFENYSISNLIVFDGSHTSQKYQNFKTAYENEGCNVINIYDDIISKNDTTLTFDENVYIEFIDTKYYDETVSKETNGRSIVFMLYAYDTKILFTGDADSQSAHPDLEENYQNTIGNIDILKVVHHATKEGTSLEFLAACDPEVAIICNGNYLGNKHSHPHVDTIGRLYEYDSNMKVYCTTGGGTDDCEVTTSGGYKCSSENHMQDRNGTITLLVDNNGYVITSEYGQDHPIEIKDTTWWKNYNN